MNHAESKKATLEGSDILFECGQCGKSLAIDYRGAGLNIRCPQCDSDLEVPIPEGFDLAELDKAISESVAADKEIRVQMPDSDAVAAASSDASKQIDELRAEIETLRTQRQDLAQQQVDMLAAIKALSRQAEDFQRALDKFGRMLGSLAGPQADETQKIG